MGFFFKVLKLATFNYFGFGFVFSWLTPKMPKGNDAQTMQEPNTSKQGDPLQIFHGRFRAKNINCVGFGERSSVAVKGKSGKK